MVPRGNLAYFLFNCMTLFKVKVCDNSLVYSVFLFQSLLGLSMPLFQTVLQTITVYKDLKGQVPEVPNHAFWSN